MTTTFKELGLSDACATQLEKLGFEAPTQIQQDAIPALLEGKDIVGQSQTGTGKTAAFALPALEIVDADDRAVQTLILTPTRELAQQVGKAIDDFASKEQRVSSLTVYGGQSIERQISRLRRGVQIVVGTPGRVIDLLERGELKLDQLKLAILDEADEMLSMGFIDDIKKILRRTPKERQTACLSATMPREIKDLIKNFLNSPIYITVKQKDAAPERIDQHVYMIPRGWQKTKALQPILEIEEPDSAIIFVRTKRTASELTSKLQEAGHSVDEYHGNLSQMQRERLVKRFRDGKVKMVVATDIAARGLDVQDLTHVINYDLPDNTETYIHRIGRTGRAGKTGTAIALVHAGDRRTLKQIERRIHAKIDIAQIPNRAQVEAKRIGKLQAKIKETLAGERMASFLPLVRELSDEYDPQAIAAAALQMVYDRDCPNWMKGEWDIPQDSYSKPVVKGRRGSGNVRSSRKGSSYNKSKSVPRTKPQVRSSVIIEQ
ncbi:DEAD/DEAH box helicase [Waterburya agarophytonicola K14]|uniref:RNA helicase n=1 Tax=Waterburya agarophytonicola KI4 TaxID=2874699 RepID=A0A964BQV5_9CYAN|nr:DEAD/DEAH box helicase [Waterburya agarophytonicola]MCC0176903.1 DEAD/DEAH box helicase [Waterburya agarophytonicola KI4]